MRKDHTEGLISLHVVRACVYIRLVVYAVT